MAQCMLLSGSQRNEYHQVVSTSDLWDATLALTQIVMYLEDGDIRCFRNVFKFLPDYTVSQYRWQFVFRRSD